MEGRQKNPADERTLLEGLLYYLSILLRYRWLIILLTGIVAIGVTAYCVASILLPVEKSPLPNTYAASALVLLQKEMGDTLSASILTALGIGTESRPTDSATGFDSGALLVLVLRSRTFVDKIIEEFDLVDRSGLASKPKSSTRGWLLARSNFQYNRTTAALTISYEDTDPVFARDVTNRMVSLLNEWFAQNMSQSNLQQKQLLEGKVLEVKSEMDKLEGRLKDLQKKYGALTAQDLGTTQTSVLASLRSQLILKEIEIKNYSTLSAIEDPKLLQLRKERENIVDLINQVQEGVGNVQDSSSDKTSLPDVQLQFNNLTIELDVQRSIYNTLSQQYEVMKLTSEPEHALQILELAEVPDMKSGPQRSRIILGATGGAFALGAALAFLLNSLSRIRTAPETQKQPSPKQ